MPTGNKSKDWFLLILFILFLAFAFQGSRGLWRPDEGRYVRCAYEMLKTEEWITPQINYTPHFSKPPVTYWLIASGLQLFGKNEWGARFFHAVAFALTAFVVALLGRKMWGNREGIAAGFIYATSLGPFFAGNVVTTDTIVTCFETLAVFSFWMGFSEKHKRLYGRLWMAAMWLFFGLAFLTKGPPGLLPLAAIAVFIAVSKDAKFPSAGSLAAGFGIFAATALPWYLIAVTRHEGLLSYFVVHEVFGRVFTGQHDRNADWWGPIRVYLPVLIGGALPWALLWPFLVKQNHRAPMTKVWWQRLRSRPKALLLVLWFSLPLLVFSLSKSRLPLYVLPLFAPLALVSAHGLVRQILSRGYRLKHAHAPAFALICIAFLLPTSKLIIAHIPKSKDTRAMWNGIRNTIEEKVGGEPYEIVAAYGNYDGLAFYSNANVECVGSGTSSSSYIPEESIEEEYDELLSSEYPHIFLTAENHKKNICTELQKRGIEYSLSPAPFGRTLIFCNHNQSIASKPVTNLAILGDAGSGDGNQKLLASALYHVDQNFSLASILFAGDNVVGWNGKGTAKKAFKKYFEEPYAALLENRVPFYAALGNHDLKYLDYEIHYPLFHMQDRRYYSKVFGPNRVAVFFLDSNTVPNDPEQLAWLARSLQDSTATWKVVVMHHPLHSTVKNHVAEPERVAALEPIFINGGVNLVCYGHNHVYERLRPIHGIRCFTVGSSGKLSRNSLLPKAPGRVAGNDKENVFLVLQFTDSCCHFTAYGPNEKIIDRGVISLTVVHTASNSQPECFPAKNRS